jgi:SAM-dependent methyltransferase
VRQVASRCRGCAGEGLAIILDLGRMPLANALLTKEQTGEAENKYPLILTFCPRCSLVQITETISPELLFRHYLYFSSFSDTMLAEARKNVEHLVLSRRLGAHSRVVEIASNDGYLLQFYKYAGVPVLGVEPAINIAAAARGRGIPTLSEFFSPGLARQLATDGHRADVIHANNVLAHVGDLDGFLTGLVALLKGDGVAIIEVPYVRDMIERVQFDTIYHEHLSYFSLTALHRLFALHGLKIVKVEQMAIHGGSLRIFVEHSANHSPIHAVVEQMLAEEVRCGLTSIGFYENFAPQVLRLKAALLMRLVELKARGQRIAAYGASAKGATLLNYCGIDGVILDFVVDRSTAKQGLYTPGTHLPIYAPEKLLEARPHCVLLLTWNFAEEIFTQQSEYRRQGGQFLVPIPEPRMI